MRILKTSCTEDQQKEDRPELERLHAKALKTDMMWSIFGGTLRLPNGHEYQVADW